MKHKNITLIFGKIALTTAIFLLITQKVQLSELLHTLEKVSITSITTASSMIMFSTLLAGCRWYYVLKSCGINTPIKNTTLQIYKGFSVSQIMPSNIGGDIYRVLAIRKSVQKYSDAAALVMLDRILGLISMLFCSIMMMPFFIDTLTSTNIGKVIIFLFFGAVLLILFSYGLNRFITKKIPILQQLMHFGTSLLKFKGIPKILILTLAITIIYVFPVTILAKDIGITIDSKIFLLVVPLITILSAIPISFAGWGVREGLMFYFLSNFGVQNEEALILSILFGIVNLIAAVPGALMFLTSSNLSRQT